MNERQGGFLISKIKSIGGRRFDKILQQKNIDAFNGAQGKILYCLWQGEKMTATELSKKSGLAKTTLSAMLARMDEQGLIAIEESPTDKRSVTISLTPAAETLRAEYDNVTRKFQNLFSNALTHKEVEMFQ